MSLHVTMSLLEGTGHQFLGNTVFSTALTAGYIEFSDREAVIIDALRTIEGHNDWATKHGFPLIGDWAVMKIDYPSDTIYIRKEEFTNLIIWRRMLREGVLEEHILHQVEGHITALMNLDTTKYIKQEMTEWDNAVKLTNYFAAALRVQIAKRGA